MERINVGRPALDNAPSSNHLPSRIQQRLLLSPPMKNRHSRNGGRERHNRLAVMAVSLSVVMALMTLCILDYSGGMDGDQSLTKVRSAQCERTCTSRIHEAALETFNMSFSSLSKSSSPLPNIGASPLALNRPKRLPTLIKVLTGFHENYNDFQPTNHHNISRKGSVIIAQKSKPQFPKPTNTIQQVATSAAHSVWKQRNSYQIHISGSMPSVNKEWEEALRWIASWDEALLLQQQQGMDVPGLQGLARIDELWQQAYSSVLDDKREDLAAFVNDLARLLQTCIDTCMKDEDFDILFDRDGDDVVSDAHTAPVGNLKKRSIFSWALGDSFSLPFRIPRKTSGLIYSTLRFLFSSATRLVVASVAVYTVHCLRMGSPFLTQLYETVVRKDDTSPAWLIEHEKEIELAKKSRHRKNASKKSKRKGSNKKSPNQQQSGKMSLNTVGWTSTTPHASNSIDDLPSKHIEDDQSSDHWESYYRRPQTYSNKGENATLSSEARNTKIDQDDIDRHFDGVPSSISISTSSVTMSNNDQYEDRNLSDSAALDEPSPRPSAQNHMLHRQPRIMTSPPRNMLVPTEEQRNQAAQQLREYQNAQVQRLMHQKKLSQMLKVPPSNEPKSTPITFDSSLRASSTSSSTKVVMPPPGFVQPINAEVNHNIQEDTFLSQNELLLSKLLDDDENNDDMSNDSVTDSFPQESSLDPSAAPFVLEGFGANDTGSPTHDKNSGSKWGMDETPGNLLTENINVKMKGVYGGSVW